MVIKFTCEYNGKHFNGFQRQQNVTDSVELQPDFSDSTQRCQADKLPDSQKNNEIQLQELHCAALGHNECQRTVQAVLESAISKYFKQTVKIVASGRTDTGVHAKGQVCSFIISEKCSDLYKACAAINAFLPEDVAVRDFELKDNFHPQFDAKSKTYTYRCYISPHRSPLRAGTYLQLYKKLDLALMQEAAKMFIGKHNFKSFASAQTDKTDFVRIIFDIKITGHADEISFTIRGSGFLRNMVRIMVGTLLDVGYGKMSINALHNAFTAQDRRFCGKTAPAHGLTLESVEY